jgi:hypothetical protein
MSCKTMPPRGSDANAAIVRLSTKKANQVFTLQNQMDLVAPTTTLSTGWATLRNTTVVDTDECWAKLSPSLQNQLRPETSKLLG